MSAVHLEVGTSAGALAKTKKPLLVADMFCGAGGTSEGAKRAAERHGLEMTLILLNHWSIAVDTQRRHNPNARIFCQDIATLRPRVAVAEGYLDLLIASPTCTHHSRARGGRPTSDQQRMDPWHIVTWCTELRIKRLFIENVAEFVEWGPIDRRTAGRWNLARVSISRPGLQRSGRWGSPSSNGA
jgi:DNA (cytosine-5)-methyltransferase 1